MNKISFCSKNEVVTIMSILLVPVSVSVSVNTTVGGANPTISGSKGARGTPPPSKFFQFHAVFRKILQNLMLPLPWRFAHPRGNPGSATAYISPKAHEIEKHLVCVIAAIETPITKIRRIVLTSHLFIFSEHMVVHKQ